MIDDLKCVAFHSGEWTINYCREEFAELVGASSVSPRITAAPCLTFCNIKRPCPKLFEHSKTKVWNAYYRYVWSTKTVSKNKIAGNGCVSCTTPQTQDVRLENKFCFVSIPNFLPNGSEKKDKTKKQLLIKRNNKNPQLTTTKN